GLLCGRGFFNKLGMQRSLRANHHRTNLAVRQQGFGGVMRAEAKLVAIAAGAAGIVIPTRGHAHSKFGPLPPALAIHANVAVSKAQYADANFVHVKSLLLALSSW